MRPPRQDTKGKPTADGKLSAAGQAIPLSALWPTSVNLWLVIMPPSHRSQFDGGQNDREKIPRDRS
jgi:hypothetical protein